MAPRSGTLLEPRLLYGPAPAAETAGVYIHVPFCARLCPYCDFDTQDRDLHLIAPFAAGLRTEIALAAPAAVHSIFFGGGTPSVLRPEQLGAVLDACRERLQFVPGCEITVECNPNNVREARLHGYQATGVNRLSLGVQAMDDEALRLLGRQHTAARVGEAVRAARASGIDNLSLDLMYGLPGQSVPAWERTLEAALELRPEHFSCYLLTLEAWTPMGQRVARGELQLPDDEVIAEQYALTRARLAAHGYQQYEISNWALAGYESRHNLGYWRAEPYLGFGPGAVSCVDGVRRKQTPDVAEYLAAMGEARRVFTEEEVLGPATAQREALMLGLRLRAGIDPVAFEARLGASLQEVCGPGLQELQAGGFVEWCEGRLRLTDRALLVSNEVILRLGSA
jgi:oxygen-independent coproporphyrinogen III oxidase